jgi:hypothetical protein
MRGLTPPTKLPNRFAAMQHDRDIDGAARGIKRYFVHRTKYLRPVIRAAKTAPLAQGPAYKPFNFFSFHSDFNWTGTATGS